MRMRTRARRPAAAGAPATARPGRRRRRAPLAPAALAALLGVAAAVLISACGAATGKLIPVADAGPLQSDFEAVAQAAETGNGDCTTTEAAILKTERDFGALPASVDAGLRATLRQGIENLRTRALALCAQPLAQTATTASTGTTTSTHSTPSATTETQTTPIQTTPTTGIPTTTTPGGGTQAPGAGEGGSSGGAGAGEGGEGEGEPAAGGGAGGSLPGAGTGVQEGAQ